MKRDSFTTLYESLQVSILMIKNNNLT